MFAQPHIKRSTSTMARMGWLKTDDMNTELFFRQPVRQFTAQPPFALRRMKVAVAMKRVAGKW